MDSNNVRYIYIHQGDDSDWNGDQFLTVNVSSASTGVDLSTMSAVFTLGSFSQTYSLENGSFVVNLAAAVTGQYLYGPICGSIKILDSKNRIRTVANKIPFYITDDVITLQNQDLVIDVPGVTIDVTVGGTVNYNNLSNKPSINGKIIEGQKDATYYNLTLKTDFDSHIEDTNNPHQVTKEQIGLGNADNTSDANKPVSIATQAALDRKQDNLTQTQLAAVNSGIDSAKVEQISTNKTDISSLQTNKQDVISDLATIRSGAGAGATAVQPATMQAALATKQDVLTTAQQAAVNSGVTSATVSQVTANTSSIAAFAPYIQSAAVRDFNEQQTVNATDLLTATGDLHALDLDLSKNTQLKKLTASGTSWNLANVSAALVSNEAPLDSTTSPQIDVSYSSLNKAALVNLFNSMPYNVGYEVVGNPTIIDGVASGFSGTDALLLTHNLDIKNGLEAVFKIHTASTIPNDNQYIMVYNPGNNSVSQPLGLWLGTSGKVAFSTRNGGIVSASALNNDTDYYLKVTSLGGVYELFYGTDGLNYTSIGTKTDTDAALTNHIELGAWTFSTPGLYRPLKGSIDLNESYIKLNGNMWFRPGVTKNLVPSGTNTGVTVTNGIASGFNTTKLLTTDVSTTPQNIIERGVRLKFNESAIGSGRYHNVFFGPASHSLVFWAPAEANGYCSVSCYLPGASNSLYYGTVPLNSTDWLWFKYTYDGTTASLYMSADGESYSLLDSKEGTISGGTGTTNIGNRWIGDGNYFGGSIDLNNTYMKFNDNSFCRGMVPQEKICSVVGCAGTADLTQTDKDIALDKGWSLTVA